MAGLEYVQLMASLPALGVLLAARTAPISAIRLEKRLKTMLRPEHLAEIETAGNLLFWPRLPLLTSDADYIRQAETALSALHNATLRQLVLNQLEMRMVVAALRRRAAGLDVPPATELWGHGETARHIVKNWRDPVFGLGGRLKWIGPLREKLTAGDASGVERTALELAWRQVDRLTSWHEFDFDAVVIYVARWALLDGWTRFDAEIAAARFADLVNEALDDAPQLKEMEVAT